VRWWMHNGFVNGAAASQRASYLPAPRSSLRGRLAGGRAAGKRQCRLLLRSSIVR